MSRGTAIRTVRIDDELWLAAKARAEAEGISVSDVIKKALQDWVDSPPPKRSKR